MKDNNSANNDDEERSQILRELGKFVGEGEGNLEEKEEENAEDAIPDLPENAAAR